MLRQATDELMKQKNDSLFSIKYKSAGEIAAFIHPRIEEIRSGNISAKNKVELSVIFQATGPWDDLFTGNLGIKIDQAITELFGDEISKEITQMKP